MVVYALAKGVAITRHRASSSRKPGVATFGPARLDPATVAKLCRRNSGGPLPLHSACVAVARSLSTSTWLGSHRLPAPLPIAFALTKADWGAMVGVVCIFRTAEKYVRRLVCAGFVAPIARHHSKLREGYHQYAGRKHMARMGTRDGDETNQANQITVFAPVQRQTPRPVWTFAPGKKQTRLNHIQIRSSQCPFKTCTS